MKVESQLLYTLMDEFIKTGNSEKLIAYLSSNSNLPGPRGNLELAGLFADSLMEYNEAGVNKPWDLCLKMTSISVEEAPVNSPDEFVPFCGTVGIGSIGAAHPGYLRHALSRLRELASDRRWRMREAVAMGLQRLLAANSVAVLNQLQAWISDASLLELRAIAASVAEPELLRSRDVTKAALQLNQQIIEKLGEVNDRKSEEFRVLRKTLGYTVSVVIVALPKEGFDYLKRLIKINDKDISWIVKENLKKNRLIKRFPNEVNSLKKQLN